MVGVKYSKTEILSNLGKKLKGRRLNSDLTQSKVSQDIGISRKTLSGIENGKDTSLYTFLRLLEKYNMLDDLFNILSLPSGFDFDLFIKESKKKKKYASHKK